MQLLVIYHWIESHCCPYLFNDVLFPRVMNYGVATSLPGSGARQRAVVRPCDPDAQQQPPRAYALCPQVPGWTAQGQQCKCPTLRLGEKDIISKKHFFLSLRYLWGSAVRGLLMRHLFIHFFWSSYPPGHLQKEHARSGFRAMGETAKLEITRVGGLGINDGLYMTVVLI